MRAVWWYLRCFGSAIRYRDLNFARDAIFAIKADWRGYLHNGK